MASPRKLKMPEIDQPVKCHLVPIPLPLLPYFRLFFDQMRVPGTWDDDASAERAYRYFGWMEAMMLCDFGETIKAQNQALAAILIMLMSDGQVTALRALEAHSVVLEGIEAGAGSTEYTTAEAELFNLDTESIGMRTNQLEEYQKALAELIGGPGIVEDPD